MMFFFSCPSMAVLGYVEFDWSNLKGRGLFWLTVAEVSAHHDKRAWCCETVHLLMLWKQRHCVGTAPWQDRPCQGTLPGTYFLPQGTLLIAQHLWTHPWVSQGMKPMPHVPVISRECWHLKTPLNAWVFWKQPHIWNITIYLSWTIQSIDVSRGKHFLQILPHINVHYCFEINCYLFQVLMHVRVVHI